MKHKPFMYPYLNEYATKSPNKIAVRFNDELINYNDLQSNAIKLAKYLTITHKKTIVILGEKSICSVILMIAAHYANASFTCLSQDWPTHNIINVISDLKADFIYLSQTSNTLSTNYKILIEQFQDILWADIDLMRAYTEHECDLIDQEIIPPRPAYIYFTSGSSNIPKGVLISRSAMQSALEYFHKDIKLNCSDIIANQVEFCFDLSIFDIFGSLYVGATLVLLSRRQTINPKQFISEIKNNGVNSLLTVPSYIHYLLKHSNEIKTIESLRQIMFSGEPLSSKMLNDLFDSTNIRCIWNLYGATEIPYVFAKKIEANNLVNDITVFENTHSDINVTSSNSELLINSPCMLSRYLSKKHTIEKLINIDGTTWYKTGDRCKISGKNIKISGRMDRLVKITGKRIDLDEIEQSIEGIEKINEVACIIHNDKVLIFYVSELESEQLMRELREILPVYCLPSKLYRLDFLPKTSSGKKDRKRLLQFKEDALEI